MQHKEEERERKKQKREKKEAPKADSHCERVKQEVKKDLFLK